jgi:hypothetical protein
MQVVRMSWFQGCRHSQGKFKGEGGFFDEVTVISNGAFDGAVDGLGDQHEIFVVDRCL